MSSGRTYWWAKDSGWWRRELVVALGEEFGPLGPAVLDWLSCEAKAQNAGGVVKTGARTLARGVFADVDSVCPVLSRLSQLGGLDDFEQGDVTFTCRISGWKSDQDRGREAARKAEQRARKSAESSTDAEDHGEGHAGTDGDMSHPVPSCPEMSPTGEDSTGGETTDVVSHQAGGSRRSRVVDQDELPDDLTPELAATAPVVLARLRDLWQQRGGNEPTLRGVGLILRRFPDRDHLSVVGELEHWSLAGRGRQRHVKDWTATLGTFLGGAATGRPVVVPAAPPASGERWRTMTDQPSEVPA